MAVSGGSTVPHCILWNLSEFLSEFSTLATTLYYIVIVKGLHLGFLSIECSSKIKFSSTVHCQICIPVDTLE